MPTTKRRELLEQIAIDKEWRSRVLEALLNLPVDLEELFPPITRAFIQVCKNAVVISMSVKNNLTPGDWVTLNGELTETRSGSFGMCLCYASTGSYALIAIGGDVMISSSVSINIETEIRLRRGVIACLCGFHFEPDELYPINSVGEHSTCRW